MDYEDPVQRDGFLLHVRVFDGRYYGSTKVQITLLDKNDNPPQLLGPRQLSFPESTAIGTMLAAYTAQDADQGDTEFQYGFRQKLVLFKKQRQ